jgi:hypothetical protein
MILWMTLLAKREHDRSWKWDVNTGILSGDAMLILAYQYFEHEPAVYAIGII